MKLSLSSAAAPEAPAEELAAACIRRGLSGLELARDGSESDTEFTRDMVAALRAAGLDLVGIHRATLTRQEIRPAAQLAASLQAPVVVPISTFDRTLLGVAAEAFTEAGARLLLAHDGDPELTESISGMLDPVPGGEAIGHAWELRPGAHESAGIERGLAAFQGRLSYVRLFGGGPESHAQTGMGIGALMGRLALARYAGPLVLVPSNPSYHYAWSAWLGRAGGWGCGSKQSDPSLVNLAGAPGARS